jgi:integrase
VTGNAEWSRATRDRREALAWRAAAVANLREEPRRLLSSLTFGEIAERWWEGVESGAIGKRRGAGDPYSETTKQGYGRDLHDVLIPEFGPRLAQELTELEWQTWVDGLRDAGLSRSRIANLLAVASAIYGWAARPTRRLVSRNPVRLVELPRRDEKPRTRVASVAEAERLLAALRPDDAVPYAVALYAGLRRQEIQRLRWEDLDLGRHWLAVQKSKSEAGTRRRVPLAQPLLETLLTSAGRHASAPRSPVARVSLMSGKLAERATAAWLDAGLQRITLHECRHTFASTLMAAGYTIKEIMVFMGHADLQTVQRYIKLLPQRANATRSIGSTATCARRSPSYFASPLLPPRVSPCIGLGLIGCGGAVGGAGAGFVAMTRILRPFRQGHHPGGDLDNQHDEPDPEHEEQPSELPGRSRRMPQIGAARDRVGRAGTRSPPARCTRR